MSTHTRRWPSPYSETWVPPRTLVPRRSKEVEQEELTGAWWWPLVAWYQLSMENKARSGIASAGEGAREGQKSARGVYFRLLSPDAARRRLSHHTCLARPWPTKARSPLQQLLLMRRSLSM